MNDTVLTMVGALVDDPSLKFTPSGAAVCSFRIASTPRKFDKETGQWSDMKDQTLFMSCSIWRQAAEAVAEGLRKGDRVVVVGKLRQRSYETREGEKRTVYEIECDEVAASLKFATVEVKRMKRNSAGTAPTGGGFEDPWASAAPAGASRGAASQGSFTDEPPF